MINFGEFRHFENEIKLIWMKLGKKFSHRVKYCEKAGKGKRLFEIGFNNAANMLGGIDQGP